MPARALIAAVAMVGGLFASLAGQHLAAPPAKPHRVIAHEAATTPPGAAPTAPTRSPPVSTTKLLGQRIMVGMNGTSAPAWLLSAARAGRVGSVILFSANIASRSQLKALTGSLQRAAHDGRQPTAADRRRPGGRTGQAIVRRAARSIATADRAHRKRRRRLEGRPSHRWLPEGPRYQHGPRPRRRRADVRRRVHLEAGPCVLVQLERRRQVRDRVRARASRARRTVATAKHFPGVGSAGVDTDNKLDVLRPTKAQLSGALAPYRSLIPRGPRRGHALDRRVPGV